MRLKKLKLQEFMSRLDHNQMDERYQNYEIMTNLLCELYTTAAKSILSPDFTVEEARKVIRGLLNKKAPGFDQITNEILKNAGDGLIVADSYTHLTLQTKA